MFLFIILFGMLFSYIIFKYRIYNFKTYLIYLIILFITYFYSKNEYNYIVIGNIIIISFLYLIIIIDYKEYIIPDLSIIILFFIYFLNNIIKYYLYHIKYNYISIIFMLVLSIISIIIMNVLKKELIGIGDLKLLMVLSLNLNLLECNILLILASCIGIISVIITKKKMIAFGPSIIYAYLIIKLVTK